MLDPKLIRNNPEEVQAQLNRRGEDWKNVIKTIVDLEATIKVKQALIEDLQHKRNQVSEEIAQAKVKSQSVEGLLKEAFDINHDLDAARENLAHFKTAVNWCEGVMYKHLPNIPHIDVPNGKSEDENVRKPEWKWGTPKGAKEFGFVPKDHVALGGENIDFEAAAKLSGSRFVVLHDKFAKLHRALAQFMLDLHTTEHGYKEVYLPYLVAGRCLEGTGQLPKFEEDLFEIKGLDLWLIPTSEVAITNLVREQILENEQLPLKYVCHSPCFRKEAGSYGKDMRGMLRQHQFDKVEMVQIVTPDESYAALNAMVKHAEAVLEKLDLPYQKVELCTSDLGFSAAKTYDLEVWLPGQNQYREISSCSNTESFQARRMQARYRNAKTNKPEYLHTLNGSGLAVGRTLIAVMENHQDKDGRIHVPEVLWKYMGMNKDNNII